MRNRKGFTMVELLVVLVIIAILAAVATPIYLANVKRSRASEAVSSMALIRQAQRDFNVGHNAYFDVLNDTNAAGTIKNKLPISANANGDPDAVSLPAGVDVDPGVSQYFSTEAYWVVAGSDEINASTDSAFSGATNFQDPPAVDFIVAVDGNAAGTTNPNSVNQVCDGSHHDDCATKAGEVEGYLLEMDNSGRTFVSYDDGTTWSAY